MNSIDKFFLNPLCEVVNYMLTIPEGLATFYRERGCDHNDEVLTDFYTGCSKCGHKEIF